MYIANVEIYRKRKRQGEREREKERDGVIRPKRTRLDVYDTPRPS